MKGHKTARAAAKKVPQHAAERIGGAPVSDVGSSNKRQVFGKTRSKQ